MGKSSKKDSPKEVNVASTEQIYDNINAVSVHSFCIPSKDNSMKYFDNIKHIFNYACTTTRKFGPFTSLPITTSPDSATLWEILQTRNKPIIRHLKKKSSKLAKSYTIDDAVRNKNDNNNDDNDDDNDCKNNYDEDIDINTDDDGDDDGDDGDDDGEEYEYNDVEEDDKQVNDYSDYDNSNNHDDEEDDEGEEAIVPPPTKNKQGKNKDSSNSSKKNKKRSRKH